MKKELNEQPEAVAKPYRLLLSIMMIITGAGDDVKWSHSWNNQRISFIDLVMLSGPCIIKNILSRALLLLLLLNLCDDDDDVDDEDGTTTRTG